MNIITVHNLSKHYGSVHAVKNIDFTVKEGAFFALLGPNGAGKTTTIEMLATLLKKDEGDVTVAGNPLDQHDDAIRKNLGIVFQYSTLDTYLTVRENLSIRSSFYAMTKETFNERLKALSALLNLGPFLDQRVQTLSGGQKRKADIARALLHNPKILMLDEPTTGLDPASRKSLWELILSLKQNLNMTIFLTTHYMEEVLEADHVIIMNEGTIVANDSADNLRKHYAQDTLKIVPKAALEKALNAAKIAYRLVNSRIHVPLNNAFEGLDIVKRFEAHIQDFEIIKATMDDVFLTITGRELEEANQ